LDNSTNNSGNNNFNMLMKTTKINKKDYDPFNSSNQNIVCNPNNINSFLNNGDPANNTNNNFSFIPPKKKLVKKLSYKSQAGKNDNGLTKINQDNFLIMENILNNDDYKIIGVFDGHGKLI